MANDIPIQLLNEFLGSAHIFAFAVREVVEGRLWQESAGNRLSVSQLRLLKLVNRSGTHSIGDVATFLGVSNAAASKAVDKMVRMMLIRRSESESDRREIQLSLTSMGKRLLQAYEQITQAKLASVFQEFDSDELRQVVSLLDRLSVGIVNHCAEKGQICVQCGIYFRDECLLQQKMGRQCLFLWHREKRAPESKA